LPYSEPHPAIRADAPVRIEGMSVFVRGLQLSAEIGLYAHERGRRQPLIVDVTLTVAPKPVAGLGDLVNYEAIAAKARAIVERGHIELVEVFAEALAAACLEDARVLKAEVRVEKPEAVPGAAAAGVTVVASRA
jgi:dihydroneopterin aldolase